MNGKKKILWRSDLWSFTLSLSFITLLCLAFMAAEFAEGRMGEGVSMGAISLISLGLTLLCAFIDRGQAMAESISPELYYSERAKSALDPRRPPDIG